MSDFPIAHICFAFARREIDRETAIKLLDPWSINRAEAETWLSSAVRPERIQLEKEAA